MRLTGWNDIPRGYGARFDVASAPAWLRLLYRTPFLDRFAYPVLVRRGLGLLRPHPHWREEQLAVVEGGWRLDDPGWYPPGSVAELKRTDGP